MFSKLRLRFIAAITVGLLGGAWAYASASAIDGCGPVEGPIIESKDFAAEQMSTLRPATLNPEGVALPDGDAFSGPTEIDDMSLWWVESVATDDGLAQGSHYLDAPVGPMLKSEFFDAGGLRHTKEPVVDKSYTIAYRLIQAGERGVPVDVGSYGGMLVWAEPDHTGTRTHNLYWSDGGFNYSLVAVRSAEEILALGRASVCEGL